MIVLAIIPLILLIGIIPVLPFTDAEEKYTDQNISIRASLVIEWDRLANISWTLLEEDKGTFVISSNEGVIVIRFDFQEHDKCFDKPNTYCLRATITDSKNTYFSKVGDEATIILEYPDKLSYSFLSGDLVTNTFEFNIKKIVDTSDG